MTVVDGDVLRTTANFTLPDGTLYQNVYHHKASLTAPFGDATVEAAIDAWLTATYAWLNALVRSTTVGDLCSIDEVSWSGTAWEITRNLGTFVHTFVPTGGAESMPNQMSPFVTFVTDRPKSVGRKFLFPMGENNYLEGVLAAATVTAIVNYANAALANVNLSPLNDLLPGVTRVGFDVFLPFALAVVTNVAGTQRKRRLGVGA